MTRTHFSMLYVAYLILGAITAIMVRHGYYGFATFLGIMCFWLGLTYLAGALK